MLLRVGDSHGPQPGHAGAPACRQALEERFIFVWTLSLNKGTSVQPWPAHFVHLLLQPEPSKDLGSRRSPLTAHKEGSEVEAAQPCGVCCLGSVSTVAQQQGRPLLGAEA